MHDSTTVQDRFSFTLTRTREIRDGRVGVIYSPRYGAGWYTWNMHHANCEHLIFDPHLIDLVEQGAAPDLIEARAKALVPQGCFLAVNDLTVEWFPQGTKFIIREYDGAESIQLMEETPWLQA